MHSSSSGYRSSQFVHLEELHPLDFRIAFGLTHEQAAEVLGIEAQTMRAYSKKSPSRRIKRLAAVIAYRWLIENKQVHNPDCLLTLQR
jgi:hypothetical protein